MDWEVWATRLPDFCTQQLARTWNSHQTEWYGIMHGILILVCIVMRCDGAEGFAAADEDQLAAAVTWERRLKDSKLF